MINNIVEYGKTNTHTKISPKMLFISILWAKK